MLRDFEQKFKLDNICKEIIDENIIFIGHRIPIDYLCELINTYKINKKDYSLLQINSTDEISNIEDFIKKNKASYVYLNFPNCSVKSIEDNIINKLFCKDFKYIISIGRFLNDEYKVLSIYKTNIIYDIIELENILNYNMQIDVYD